MSDPDSLPDVDSAVIDSLPARLTKITVEGNERTELDFIDRQLSSVYSASSFGQIREELFHSLHRLHSLDLFKEAQFEIDTASDSLSPHEYQAKLLLKEKRRYGGKTEVARTFGIGENIGSVSFAYRNLFGRGEKFQSTVSYGDSSSTSFSVSLSKPQVFSSSHTANLSFFKQVHNQAAFSSFSESNAGISAQLVSGDGVHTVGYEGVWRDLIPTRRYLSQQEKQNGISNAPSSSINSLCFPSVKSSLKYSFLHDATDSKSAPTRGFSSSASLEVAGFGGDVSFFKGEADAKFYRPINNRISAGFSFMTGMIRPWSSFLPQSLISKFTHPPHPSPSPLSVPHLSDRFFLGGPLSLRGFQMASIGPRDGDDMLGGDFIAAAAAHLQVQLPGKVMEEAGIKANFFINAGNLLNLPTGKEGGGGGAVEGVKKIAQNFTEGTRVSVGAGLIIPTQIARVEFTASVPVRKQRGDDLRMFQVGIGFKFI